MKKLICIVLTAVLLLSLTPMALAATLSDFEDAGAVAPGYAKAVNSLLAIGLVEGSANLLDLKGYLTREQAAKIVAYLSLGKDAADKLTVADHAFTDVSAGRWSASYVQYCYQAGIVQGVGNGKFAPANNVTGTEAAKMLLCAMGYGKAGEYSGDAWDVNVAGEANKQGLFDEIADGFEPADAVTREVAFQMIHNALESKMVKYDKTTGVYTATENTLGSKYRGLTEGGVCYVNYADRSAEGAVRVRAWFIDGTTSTFTVSEPPADAASLLGVKRYVKTPNQSSGWELKLSDYKIDDSDLEMTYAAVTSGSVSFGGTGMKIIAAETEMPLLSFARLFVHRGGITIDKYDGTANFPVFSHTASVSDAVFYRMDRDMITDVFVLNHVDIGGTTTETIYGREAGVEGGVCSFTQVSVVDGEVGGVLGSKTRPITPAAAEKITEAYGEAENESKELKYFTFTVTNGTITNVAAEYGDLPD